MGKDIVEDIYGLLQAAIDGQTVEPSEEALDRFGELCKAAVRKALSSRQLGRRPKTVRMSEAGRPCWRQLWYKVHGYKEEKLRPENMVKFLYGDILEALLLYLVEECGHTVTDIQKELRIELPYDWQLLGHIDAKIDGKIVDCKSASSYSFNKMTSGGLDEDDPFGYKSQLALYNEAEDSKPGTETSFLVIDKTLGKIAEVPFTTPEITHPLETAESRLAFVRALESTTPPERAFTDEPLGAKGNRCLKMTCGYCPFKGICWEDANGGKGLRTFVYSKGPVFMTKVVDEPRVPEA